MDMNKKVDITSKRYFKYSLWLIAALTLLCSAAISMNVLKYSIVNALAISALYTVFINSIYVVFWRKMAKTSPNVMTKFYLAASALRLVSAVVVTAYCLICHDKNSIRDFALLFMSFYIVMLVFDSVFFAHVEKSYTLKD